MILKKLFLLLTLLFSTTYAQGIPKLEIIAKTYHSLTLSSTQAPQAWIGIYQKDAPLTFENVLVWDWVTADTTSLDIPKIQDGEYEARLFFNNSFQLEKAVTFQHLNGQGPDKRYNRIQNQTTLVETSNNFNISYRERGLSNITDWVGVFKPNTSHIRKNLLAWGYLNIPNEAGMGTVPLKTLDGQILQLGKYDMVCFANDGYDQQLGETKTLTVDFRAKYASGISNTLGYVLDSYVYLNQIKQEKDWIAIFKKDKDPIRENIIAWSYISEGVFPREDAKSSIIQFPKLEGIFKEFEGDDYDVILFEKDTYNILQVMTPISI
jgi:hypothetical protein